MISSGGILLFHKHKEFVRQAYLKIVILDEGKSFQCD